MDNVEITVKTWYPSTVSSKIRALRERKKMTTAAQSEGKKVVFTNGCFDILHSGHLKTLRFAKNQGDRLLVAVNSDESVRKIKGKYRPIISLKERMEMLASLDFVDYVVSFEEDTPIELIKKIKPEVLIKGGDWEGRIVGSDIAKETIAVPLLIDRSTTNIVERIKDELQSANEEGKEG